MLVWGSVVNVVVGAVALVAFASGAPGWIGVLIYLSPLPYNFFLALAVARQAERQAGGGAFAYKAAALSWLVVASLI